MCARRAPVMMAKHSNKAALSLSRHFASGAVVCAVAVLCFWNSFDGDFVFDDAEAIIDNKDLLPDADVWSVWSHDFWGDPISSKTSHKSYRPLTVLTFRWNYRLADGLHPLGFHLVNIALHALCSVLLYAVALLIFSDHGPCGAEHSSSGMAVVTSSWPSFLSAVLFAAHPVHSESVAAVVGRADLLAAVFFFAALICFAGACPPSEDGSCHDTDRPCCPARQSTERAVTRTGGVCAPMLSRHWLLLALSLCFSAVSMLCKEQGITALAVMLLYDLFLVCKLDPWKAIAATSNPDMRAELHRRLVPSGFVLRQIAVAAVGVVCLAGRWHVMGGQAPTFQPMDNPAAFSNSSATRMLTYNYLYALNGWLLLCPHWLCFDWAMGCVPLVESMADARCLAAVVFWSVILALAHRCVRRQALDQRDWDTTSRLVVVAAGMIVIPFLPASNLLFRVGFVVAERVLYLPSAGFCILVALGYQHLHRHVQRHSAPVWRHVVGAGFLLTLLVFVARSSLRSGQWRHEESLFGAGMEVCPLNAKVHYNIGKLRADAGKGEQALASYQEAVRLHPNYDQALNNLGNLLKEQGRPEEAHSALLRAVDVNPEFAAAWMNLAIVKADLNLVQESERCYHQAILHRRKYPDAWFNLGNLYLKVKLHDNATQAWKKAIELKSSHAGAWHNLALAYEETGRLKEARSVLQQALRILPDNFELHLTMANVCGKLEDFPRSEKAFRSAISFAAAPAQQASAWANLGVLYHRAKDWKQAALAYRQAEALNPGQTGAKQHLDMLKRNGKA